MWQEVLERFEKHEPASVMARIALEQAMPAAWIDEVFEAKRQRQYPRELLFSTVVELMSMVSLGLQPSLHAAARKMENLPVSLAALYDKVKRTELPLLRALVQGSSARLQPIAAALDVAPCVPGWQLRIVDGNHLPGSQKRLVPLRGHRGAALPGHSLVVYDPDLAQVVDLVACEDAYESERTAVMPLFDSAGPGQIWIADRHFCTRTILQRCHEVGASFIVRQHSKHPVIVQEGPWLEAGRCETGQLREQTLHIDEEQAPWRRIELQLDQLTESGESTLWLWSNLPGSISAGQIASLYRRRWSIESMFGRLESVLNSEITTLGHPRAALLGFTVAVLAYNLLSLIKRYVEHAHRQEAPQLDVSTYHLALHVKGAYAGLLIAVPPAHWPNWAPQNTDQVVQRLLALARRIIPRQVATSKRGPKIEKPKGWVAGDKARAHVSTARVLKAAMEQRP